MSTTVTTTGVIDLPSGATINLDLPQLVNPLSVGATESVTIGTAPTTLILPAGTRFISVAMPALNAIVSTLKGAAGDVGISMDPVLGIPSLPVNIAVTTQVVLTAAAPLVIDFTTG